MGEACNQSLPLEDSSNPIRWERTATTTLRKIQSFTLVKQSCYTPASHRIHARVPEVLEGESGGQLEERRRNVFGLAQGENLLPREKDENSGVGGKNREGQKKSVASTQPDLSADPSSSPCTTFLARLLLPLVGHNGSFRTQGSRPCAP